MSVHTHWFREASGQDVNAIEIYREQDKRVAVVTADEVMGLQQRINDLTQALNDLLFASDGDYPPDSPQGRTWTEARALLDTEKEAA